MVDFNGQFEHIRGLSESEWRIELYMALKNMGGQLEHQDGHLDAFEKRHEVTEGRLGNLEHWRERLAGVFTVIGFVLGSGGLIGLIVFLLTVGQ